MSVRSVPYPSPGYRVRIPIALWSGALNLVRAYSRLGSEDGIVGSEALLYLGGVVAGSEMVVTSLYRLNHEPQGDRVVVTRDQSRWLVRALRDRDEKLVAQVHSHRYQAWHSIGDDAHATSFHEGFLSVVVPFFGKGVSTPEQCAVLEFEGGHFRELGAGEVIDRLVFVDDTVEPPDTTSLYLPGKEGRWAAFAQKLRSIGQRQR